MLTEIRNLFSSKLALIPAWALLNFFGVLQFTLQGCLGIMSEDIKKSYNIDAASLGLMSSSFFYSYIAMQLPVGILFDRFGIKKCVTTGLIGTAISCLILATSKNFAICIVARTLMGLFCAFGFIGILSASKSWFGLRQFAIMIALSECLCMFGTAISNRAISRFLLIADWRQCFILIASVAFSLGFLASIIIPSHQNQTSQGNFKNLLLEFVKLLRLAKLWAIGFYSAAMFSIMSVFVGLWAIPFFKLRFHLNLVDATTAASMIYIGIACASPILGIIIHQIRCSYLMLLSSSICTVIILMILLGPTLPYFALIILMILLGFFCATYQVSFTLVSYNVNTRIQATACALVNMLTISGNIFLQPIIGMIISQKKDTVSFDAFEAYSVSHFQDALCTIPLTLCLASFVAYFLKEGVLIKHPPENPIRTEATAKA